MNHFDEMKDAVRSGDVLRLRALYDKGSFSERKSWLNDFQTLHDSLLTIAIVSNNTHMINTLLYLGADPAALCIKSGLSPAHYAANSGNMTVMSIFLDTTDVRDVQTSTGVTLLETAIEAKHYNMALLLRKHYIRVTDNAIEEAKRTGLPEFEELVYMNMANVTTAQFKRNPLERLYDVIVTAVGIRTPYNFEKF